MFLKTVALTVAIAGLGTTLVTGAANAAAPTGGAVPLCSRSITDNCMNPLQAPKAVHHVAATHRTAHHSNKVASATLKKTAVKKG